MSRSEWLIENTGQYCLSCRQDKKGKFLLVFLESSDVGHGGKRLFVAICEDCINLQPFDKAAHLEMVTSLGHHPFELFRIYDCIYSPEDLQERGKTKDTKPFDRRIFN